MKGLKLLLFVLLIFAFSCGDETDNNIIWDKAGSPHFILTDLTLKNGEDIYAEPGAEIIISDGVNINTEGSVFLEGTEYEPIIINPETPGVGWGTFSLKGPSDYLVMDHVKVTDGIITSYSN